MDLKVTLGTVNYTDFLHITVKKVATGSPVVWEVWIDVPITNYNLVIPGLDPDVYYLSFYDSPDDSSLGTFVSQAYISALSPEFAQEIRFYEIGNLPAGASLNGGSNILTDTYLIGKNVKSTFKEGFRFLEPDDETVNDSDAGSIELLNGIIFSPGEKFVITIQYAVGNTAVSSNGLYTGTINVSPSTYTLLAGDKNKRVRCTGSAATQVITLPSLAAMSNEDGYFIDNSVGGVANQVRILFNGSDKLLFAGFMLSNSDLFDEFWVDKGTHILIKKYGDNWELLTDYKGSNVGERFPAGYKSHPMCVSENGQLMDGDEWPRMYWWIRNVLPATHRVTDDGVTTVPYVYDFATGARRGQFIIHSTLKKFRMPKTNGLVDKGMGDMETYGGDTANRPIDYPGGIQGEMVGPHKHGGVPLRLDDVDRGGDGSKYSIDSDGETFLNDGTENRVTNNGVVFLRRM